MELDKRLGKESEKYPGGAERMFEVEKRALDELRTSGSYTRIDDKLVADIALIGKVHTGVITKTKRVCFAALSGNHHRLMKPTARILHIWKNHEETESLSEGEEGQILLAADLPKGKYTGLIMMQGEFI